MIFPGTHRSQLVGSIQYCTVLHCTVWYGNLLYRIICRIHVSYNNCWYVTNRSIVCKYTTTQDTHHSHGVQHSNTTNHQ